MYLYANEDYRIKADKLYCFEVQERSVVSDEESKNYGAERWTPITWHSNLPLAVESLLSKSIAVCKDLMEVVDAIREVRREVSKVKVVAVEQG